MNLKFIVFIVPIISGMLLALTMNPKSPESPQISMLSPNPLVADGLILDGPDFSPDGRYIALTISKHEKELSQMDFDIHIYDLETGKFTKIAYPTKYDWVPRFSWDGKLISFMCDWDLCIHDLSSGRTLRYGFGFPVLSPAFSPDSSKIAFASDDPLNSSANGIYIFDLRNSSLVKLVGSPDERYAYVEWSPLGEIYFSSRYLKLPPLEKLTEKILQGSDPEMEFQELQLYEYDPENSSSINLGPGYIPRWVKSWKGRWISYTYNGNIWILNLDSGYRQMLVNLSHPSYVSSIHGDRIAFCNHPGTGSQVLISELRIPKI